MEPKTKNLAFVLISSIAIIGCGGSANVQQVRPSLKVWWPEFGREFAAPNGASMVRVLITTDKSENVLEEIFERPSGPDAKLSSYVFKGSLAEGTGQVVLLFTSGTGGTMAYAALEYKLTRDGVMRSLNGQVLPTIVYTSNVSGYEVMLDGRYSWEHQNTLRVGKTRAANMLGKTNRIDYIENSGLTPLWNVTAQVIDGKDVLEITNSVWRPLKPGTAKVKISGQLCVEELTFTVIE